MIIGNSETFAIESEITQAYERLSLRALGFFVIHIKGRSYGVRDSEATMLAIAFEGVGKRLNGRGTHRCPITPYADAVKIAVAFSHANDSDNTEGERSSEMSNAQLNASLRSNGCVWAPDGEEGFDDGSRILQFDVGNEVRLVAFHSTLNYEIDPSSLREVWLSQEEFYNVLREWHSLFEEEWFSLTQLKEQRGLEIPL